MVVIRHVGFRINALASLLPNAAWGKLAAEWLKAKDDPALMRVFHNTALAQPWEDQGSTVDEGALAARAEAFDLDGAIPLEVTYLTAGVDCADDRLEVVICGWTRDKACLVFAHEVIFGAIEDDLTWRQLDELLRQRWQHPRGGKIGIDACAIDGGDGGHLQHVLAFARPRAARRVMCVKGVSGFSRPPLLASRSKMKGGGRLWIVGVDAVKNQIFGRVQRGNSVRFSKKLEAVYFEQLASERVVMRTVAGRPVRRFERIKGMKAEALDATCYAWAARSALNLTSAAFEVREGELKNKPAPPPMPQVIRSQWMSR
jgi:phage terminase large subunit GpA-like protein